MTIGSRVRGGAVVALLLVALSVPAMSASADQDRRDHSSASVPRIAAQWAGAWNASDAAGMAALFTEDGTYEDFAFQARFEGSAGISAWVTITQSAIPDAHVQIREAFRSGQRVTIEWTFTGTPVAFGPDIPSTGRSFSVPAVTVLELSGRKIQTASDYYNLADVLRQVGLPAGPYVPPAAN